MKTDNDKEHKEISEKFQKIDTKLEELSKFRWQVGGVIAVAIILLGIFNAFAPKFLDKQPQQVIIERTK